MTELPERLDRTISEVLKVKEAMTRLHCGRSTVYDLFNRGELRGYRVGRRGIRIYADSITEYIARRENRPEPDQAPKDPGPARPKLPKPVKTRRYAELVPVNY
jgi:excisionase family DNA binding protein